MEPSLAGPCTPPEESAAEVLRRAGDVKQHCHDEHVRVVVRPRRAVLAVHLVDLLAVVAGAGAPPEEQHEVVEDLGMLDCWYRHMMVKSALRNWLITSMAVTAALNGLGLALQIPTIYTFVADSFDGTSRVGTVEAERHNAVSLARALYTGIAVPMVLCCLVYSFLY
uniref:Uncharacterized protein n=1 Tax=Oryza barthii TaxID=65489 RepID=A0A0D3F9E5_9ORYZ